MKGLPERTMDECGAEKEPLPPGSLERAARAICLASSIDLHGGKPSDWAPCVDQDWPDYLPEARAAIAALREVTQVQYDALCATDLTWREMNSRLVWQTYIDAALTDAPVEASPRQVVQPIREEPNETNTTDQKETG